MALTADGKALTEAHRVGQIAIAARAEMDARALWRLLDPHDLDRSEPQWMAANLNALRAHYEDSQNLAVAYMREYRAAEGAASEVIARQGWDPAYMAANLHLAGPVRVKLLTGRGMAETAAAVSAITKFGGIIQRSTLSGGRLTIFQTARRDSGVVGWRRVTDGDPCTFCAMLATRGPVYTSREKAISTPGDGIMTGSPLRYHGHCGCTAELVYDGWEPSPVEQLYIEAYLRAAAEVDALGLPRTEEHILPRMRRYGVFRDSPLVRNKTSGP